MCEDDITKTYTDVLYYTFGPILLKLQVFQLWKAFKIYKKKFEWTCHVSMCPLRVSCTLSVQHGYDNVIGGRCFIDHGFSKRHNFLWNPRVFVGPTDSKSCSRWFLARFRGGKGRWFGVDGFTLFMSMILGCFVMWIDVGGLPSVCSFVLRSCVRFQGELGKSEMIPVGVVDDIDALASFWVVGWDRLRHCIWAYYGLLF